MQEREIQATFWEHCAELRLALLKGLIAIIFACALCIIFYQDIFALLSTSLENSLGGDLAHISIKKEKIVNRGEKTFIYQLPKTSRLITYDKQKVEEMSSNCIKMEPGATAEIEKEVPGYTLAIFGPIEGILITFKICFWTSLLLSSPFWLYFSLHFLSPAFTPKLKRVLFPFLILTLSALSLGTLFAFKITLPLANSYLMSFNASIGDNYWSLSSYVDYTILLILTNAIGAELALILFFLVHFRVLQKETLIAKRRHFIVISFIMSAILTPPDVFSQIILAIPLIIFYEGAIAYAKFQDRTK